MGKCLACAASGLLCVSFTALTSAQSFLRSHPLTDLSPQSLAKLESLTKLTQLPAPEWRMHVGDLPHGETTNDADWTVVGPNTKAPNDAVWYRRVIEVPKTLDGYDISGSQVQFQFRADANGPMPEIIYFNGRRVALGDDLEPIVLFNDARPGEKIDVAVKLLHTVDVKSVHGAVLSIQPPTAGDLPAGVKLRPNPQDIREECITAAYLLPVLPTPRRDLLPAVEKAIAAIDTDALHSGNQERFDASLRRAQEILEPIRPVLAQVHMNLTGNSHIDAAWLWPWTETVDTVKRTFTSALQLMNEYPQYTYSQSAAQYYEWMTDKYPQIGDQIRDRVKDGRWEIVGGMWVEPDLNLPDGETEVRQLLIGQRYFQKNFGTVARIGWNPDSFGYNWQLPQIYKRSGLDYFVTQKMHWNDTNQLPLRIFWWEAPDGSKVLTYFPTDYAHTDLDPERLSGDFVESAERNPGLTDMMDLYGVGDHGGGPTRAILDQGEHYIAATESVKGQPETNLVMPTMRFGTAQHYFDTVEPKLASNSPTWNYDTIAKGHHLDMPAAGQVAIPTWDSELYLEYHRGVFTTQAKMKASMRRSEVETIDAEKLASLAWLQGQTYPNAALTDSWKKITFNSFHDLAAGSGIAVIYRDAQKDYTQVFNSDHLIDQSSLHTLAAGIDTRVKGDTPILVVNPLAWPRTETVAVQVQLPVEADSVRLLDAHDHPLLTQLLSKDDATHTFNVLARVDDIPALGYAVIHAEPGSADKGEHGAKLTAEQTATGFTLSNGKLSLTINKADGCITSLKDAKGTEFLAANACGNQLQTFVDKPKNYDAWNIDPGTLDHFTPISNVDLIELVDQGPLRATVRVVRTWQSSKFIQNISLDAGADTVEFRNHVDWHETHVLLKAAFPLSATGPKATYEIPYGTIERSTERKNSWEQAQFEVPALRWADMGNSDHGLSLLNDSKYGYDGVGNLLRLSLLRSPTWPDPDADRGSQDFTYAIYPHEGTWKDALTMHRGYELNYPVSAMQTESHTGSLPPEHSWISVENPNVTLTDVKKAEDSNALVFRLVEWAGKAGEVKLHIPVGATGASEVNLMEKPASGTANLENNVITVPISPYEILSVEAQYPAHTPQEQEAAEAQ